MDFLRYYEKYTMEQLVQLDKSMREDPLNKNTDGGIYLYNKKTRKKMDEISRAITMHLEDKRIAKGDPVVFSGYSGRQTNRR